MNLYSPILSVLILLTILSCKETQQPITLNDAQVPKTSEQPAIEELPVTNGFNFPVGQPDAAGYYNAQPFKKNNHLGDDWNAVTGRNTDLGDPIYAVANGQVTLAKDLKGGWGNVIRLLHKLPNGKTVESIYAHCDKLQVQENQIVTKGSQIGTIGTAHGMYLAHLHFEIRDTINMDIGPGYSENTAGYLDPTAFIKSHRK